MAATTPASLPPEAAYRSPNLWLEALRNLRHSPSALLGMIIIGALVIIAIFAPVFATHDPIKTMIGVPGETGRLPSKPPCIPILGCDEPQHILGLDLNARDLYSRVLYGTRTSLSVGVITISLSIIVGTTLGLIAGYAGGTVDNVIMRLMDVILAFPALLLAISIVTILGPGLTNALLGITITFIPQYARLVAGERFVDQGAGVRYRRAGAGRESSADHAGAYPAERHHTDHRAGDARRRHGDFGRGGAILSGTWARNRRRRNGDRSSANLAITCLRRRIWYSSPASRS